MGTSFENIHIYTQRAPRNSCPAGGSAVNCGIRYTKENEIQAEQSLQCRIVRLAENWMTLFPETGSCFGEGIKLARKLSKELTCPILWVSYFDDDMAELAVYQNGKKMCGYRINDSGHVFLEKPKVWKSVLNLSDQEGMALRQISICEETPEGTFELLSHLLGLPLYTIVFPDPADIIEPYHKQDNWAEEWLRQRQALTKISNHTYMKLCCEQPGIHTPQDHDRDYGIIRLCPPDGKGAFTYNHTYCYFINDETLVPVYDYRYPEEIFGDDDKSLWLDYYHKDILIMDVDAVGNGDGQLYWDAYIDRLESLISDNHRLESHPLAQTPKPADMIETPEGNFRYFCNQSNSQTHSPMLVKKHLDGTECQSYQYESDEGEDWFWGYGQVSLQVSEKQIIMAAQKIFYGKTGRIISNIRFFDSNLNLLREEEFSTYKEHERMNDCFLYSPENDTIYYSGCSCNLGSHKISRCVPPVDGNTVYFDQKKNIILINGSSTVIVLNPELQILSRHKLKGKIYEIYKNKSQNCCFITADENVYDWNRPHAKAAVRIYELSYPSTALRN